ncbi:MAG: hypothetical protein HeimC3_31830 [Candidatus Heimdallarchaeota archaeon LC_3]|nr:MAG: hypothetical protein HeimC3_31830 [Candidatus Heimdallarchaeota archaeon LC_3]
MGFCKNCNYFITTETDYCPKCMHVYKKSEGQNRSIFNVTNLILFAYTFLIVHYLNTMTFNVGLIVEPYMRFLTFILDVLIVVLIIKKLQASYYFVIIVSSIQLLFSIYGLTRVTANIPKAATQMGTTVTFFNSGTIQAQLFFQDFVPLVVSLFVLWTMLRNTEKYLRVMKMN